MVDGGDRTGARWEGLRPLAARERLSIEYLVRQECERAKSNSGPRSVVGPVLNRYGPRLASGNIITRARTNQKALKLSILHCMSF